VTCEEAVLGDHQAAGDTGTGSKSLGNDLGIGRGETGRLCSVGWSAAALTLPPGLWQALPIGVGRSGPSHRSPCTPEPVLGGPHPGPPSLLHDWCEFWWGHWGPG
jgi:hypothetical protein